MELGDDYILDLQSEPGSDWLGRCRELDADVAALLCSQSTGT